MAIFTKSDLRYTYTWTVDKGDNPNYRSGSDSAKLDRNEGYEVLYFIKDLMAKWNFTTTVSGQKIEKMIHAAPGTIQTRIGIMTWIGQNWNYYSA